MVTITAEVWVQSKPRGLWWTTWHLDWFFSEYFSFPLPVWFNRASYSCCILYHPCYTIL